jgi:hypothetical protein
VSAVLAPPILRKIRIILNIDESRVHGGWLKLEKYTDEMAPIVEVSH